ncbi:MAG: DeoR family transcriptional regulator [Alphaproteobacteria bacterium]
MDSSARQTAILRAVALKGLCSVAELASQLSVADQTTRRDIKLLARDGLARKVHRGVILLTSLKGPGIHHESRKEGGNPCSSPRSARLLPQA